MIITLRRLTAATLLACSLPASPVRAEVVYCQRLDDKRFFIGLKFPKGKVPWAVLKRFDGI